MLLMKFDFLMVHVESDTCGHFGCCGAGLDAQIRWNGYPFSVAFPVKPPLGADGIHMLLKLCGITSLH